jgi:hypothetical protein
MSIFSRKSKFVGQPVNINDSQLSPKERYDRASTRVRGLETKLRYLKERVSEGSDILTAIDNTEYALAEWKKRCAIAKYEIEVYSTTSGDGA